MLFPETKRVIYNHNPLIEVVCQVRFPRILRLDTSPPSEFQDKIKSEYPEVSERRNIQVKIPDPDSIAPDSILSTQPVQVEYHFSDDPQSSRAWRVVVRNDSLALVTGAYTRWEEFQDRLINIFDSFFEIYEPQLFTRIGLRYKDVIDRQSLGLEQTHWDKLINPKVLGILGSDFREEDIPEHTSMLQLRLDHDDENELRVRIQHGLAAHKNEGQIGYLIDSDFYCASRMERIDVTKKLKFFNTQAGRLFRWFITQDLHNAMDPKPI